MKDEEVDKLSYKCTELRDRILDKEFDNEDDISKEIKSLFSKKEIEYMAIQFLLRETLLALMDKEKENKKIEEIINMYG